MEMVDRVERIVETNPQKMDRLKEIIALYGWQELISKGLARFFRPLYSRWDYYVYVRNGLGIQKENDEVISYTTLDEIPAFLLEQNESFAKECQLYLAESNVFVAQEGDKLIGWGFLQVRGTYRAKEISITISEGQEAFKKNLMVLAPWRGRGVAGKIHRARLSSVSVECLVYGLVMKNNYPQIKNMKRLSFSQIGTMSIIHTLFTRHVSKFPRRTHAVKGQK